MPEQRHRLSLRFAIPPSKQWGVFKHLSAYSGTGWHRLVYAITWLFLGEWCGICLIDPSAWSLSSCMCWSNLKSDRMMTLMHFTSAWLISNWGGWRFLCVAGSFLWSTEAIMAGCSSWHHQKFLSGLNLVRHETQLENIHMSCAIHSKHQRCGKCYSG